MEQTVKNLLDKTPALKKWIRLGFRAYHAHWDGYPRWKKILKRGGSEWERALSKASQGPKILIGTSVGSFLYGTTLESLLSVALTLRGAEAHVLLCDELLPACLACDAGWYPNEQKFVAKGPQADLCRNCFQPAFDMYSQLGVKVHRYSDHLEPGDIERADRIARETPRQEIAGYREKGVAVGEHAVAGTLRYFARAELDGEQFGEPILRRYFKASLLANAVFQRLFDKIPFTTAVFHHGIYVPQGVLGEAARARGIRVANWNPAYRKKCFIFSHRDTYHHTFLTEPTEKWENIPWNETMEQDILRYLKSRWQGTEDWIWFHEKPQTVTENIVQGLKLDTRKTIVGLLTNVMWDAQLHYPANAFPNMREWVMATIRYYWDKPEFQLVIRVHPAEIRGTLRSRQPIVAEIQKEFPQLPSHIVVVPPESSVSTYALMSLCNTVLIYGTKTGVELVSMGIPVIVAGEAWIRNKGLTQDAVSQADYFRLLDQLPAEGRLDEAVVQRARKYAYHFFFRRMIPIESIVPQPGKALYKIDLETPEALKPGRDKGLDIVCDGILNESDFIFPKEQTVINRGELQPCVLP